MDISKYLSKMSNFDLLDKKEEQKIFNLVKSGCSEARNLAIKSNLRLVVNIAKKYLFSKNNLSDLIQTGNEGLIRAVDKFEPNRELRFSTYATFWIKQSILKYLNESKNIIRYPSYVLDLISKTTKFIRSFQNKNKVQPNNKDITDHLGISESDLTKILELIQTSYTSFEDQVSNGAFISAKETTHEDNMCENILTEKILEMISLLREKEKKIISHRFGLFGKAKMTLEELAQIMKLTRERVRQIEQTVLAKIKERATRLYI
jgi:RNA polymerase sigma factor (sigma-70 family)